MKQIAGARDNGSRGEGWAALWASEFDNPHTGAKKWGKEIVFLRSSNKVQARTLLKKLTQWGVGKKTGSESNQKGPGA